MEEKVNVPEPHAWLEIDEDRIGRLIYKAVHWSPEEIAGEHRRVAVYTAEQMRSFGELCARMAREEAAQIVQAEIDSAEALLNVEEGGGPVFDRAQMDAGICALHTVLAAIKEIK